MAARITVLLPLEDGEKFEAYCQERGHKKSTLIARLIREHLEREAFSEKKAGTVRRNRTDVHS